MPQIIQFVHVPKTGGSNLRRTLGYHDKSLRYPGHRYPVSVLPREDAIITIVRDPVERFVSAFWHAQPVGFSSPNELAETLHASTMSHGLVFKPQSRWIDIERPLLWVGHTETLADDYLRLKELLKGPVGDLEPKPKPHYPKPNLSKLALDNLRAYYAADYALLARL